MCSQGVNVERRTWRVEQGQGKNKGSQMAVCVTDIEDVLALGLLVSMMRGIQGLSPHYSSGLS